MSTDRVQSHMLSKRRDQRLRTLLHLLPEEEKSEHSENGSISDLTTPDSTEGDRETTERPLRVPMVSKKVQDTGIQHSAVSSPPPPPPPPNLLPTSKRLPQDLLLFENVMAFLFLEHFMLYLFLFFIH